MRSFARASSWSAEMWCSSGWIGDAMIRYLGWFKEKRGDATRRESVRNSASHDPTSVQRRWIHNWRPHEGVSAVSHRGWYPGPLLPGAHVWLSGDQPTVWR